MMSVALVTIEEVPMTLNRSRLAGLVVGGLLSTAVFADAVEVEGARFDDRLEVGEQRFVRLGHGLFEYLIWDAYAGAYYQGEDHPDPTPQATIPRHLELEYFHDIEAEEFAEATRERVRAGLGDDAYAALESALEDFNDRYRDVSPGDRYALTWADGRLTLALNDRRIYEGDDPALADALFGIWLGEAPLGEAFRDALLGR
jgi:hypothetical protein